MENCRHVYHIYGKEEFDEEGNIIPGELEKEFISTLKEKEEKLNVYIENCHVALIDLTSRVEELNDGKKVLEDAFQVYIQCYSAT